MAYFFVTDSGKVYIAPSPVSGKTKAPELWYTTSTLSCKRPEKWDRKAEVLWSNTDKPITTLISDIDTGRTFAFGKDFYFELRAELQPAPLKEDFIREVDVVTAAEKIAKYARIVHRNKDKIEVLK